MDEEGNGSHLTTALPISKLKYNFLFSNLLSLPFSNLMSFWMLLVPKFQPSEDLPLVVLCGTRMIKPLLIRERKQTGGAALPPG